MLRDLIYQASTDNICVKVHPQFLEEESDPESHKYLWAYHVRIENGSKAQLQLINRHWKIVNGFGLTEEVHGVGVVGEQPILKPGDSYEYTSAAPLNTPSGMMFGTYDLTTIEGFIVSVTIPTFSLDSPYYSASVN